MYGYVRPLTADEIYHYGVKGMKWGVRNGPPYPINRDSSNIIDKNSKSNIIKEAINKGEVSLKVNEGHQKKHLLGKNYIEGRSYLYGDLTTAKELIDKYATKGEAVF